MMFTYHKSYVVPQLTTLVLISYSARPLTVSFFLEPGYVAALLKSSQQRFYGRHNELVMVVSICTMRIQFSPFLIYLAFLSFRKKITMYPTICSYLLFDIIVFILLYYQIIFFSRVVFFYCFFSRFNISLVCVLFFAFVFL